MIPFRTTFRFLEESDPTEPANDQPEAARALELPGTTDIQLVPGGDVDHLAVEITETGTLTVELQGVPDAVSPRVEVFGPDGAALRGSKTFSVLPGRHVLKVYDSRQSRWSHFPFTIAVRLTQP